jgi:hypothetical protein
MTGEVAKPQIVRVDEDDVWARHFVASVKCVGNQSRDRRYEDEATTRRSLS